MIANMYQLALKNKKEMAIQCQEPLKTRTQLAIAQSANNEYAHQVQCLSMNNRILSEQMSSICSIMETLTKALSCNDSTLSSLSDAIARVKQMQAVKLPPSIPKEVVTNGCGAMDATAGNNITPDKFTEETGDNKQQEVMTAEGSKPAAMKPPPQQGTTMNTLASADGFSLPSKRHMTPASAAAAAAAAKSTADNIETSNSFEALHYLGKTRKTKSPGNDMSPSKTRSKKKKKINEAVKAALNKRFAQQEQAVSAGVNLALAGKVDTSITLGIFGRVANAAESFTGLEPMK